MPEELRHAALELEVQLLGAADEPHARHAVAPLVEARSAAATMRGWFGEAEVVVGAEVQHLAPGDLISRDCGPRMPRSRL